MDPIIIGKAECLSITPERKEIGILIHHSFSKEEIHNAEVKMNFARQKNAVVDYLIDEGFIPAEEIDDWKCVISGMYHPPEQTA